MDTIELDRKEGSPTETIGTLTVNKKVFGVSLEPPKRSNKTDISCIPTGVYKFKKYKSKKFKRICLALYNIEDRNYISMHNGVHYLHTLGCVIVGRFTGKYEGKRAVMHSKAALKDLTDMVGDKGKLIIREAF